MVLLPAHITSQDAEELVEMVAFFRDRWRAAHCVGAIKSHIPITAPQDHQP